MDKMSKEMNDAKKIFTLFAENGTGVLFNRVQAAFSAPTLMAGQLFGAEEGLTMADLASIADCTPSRVTAIVGSWEEEGIAERFQKEGDRLHTFVRLTPKGKDLTEKRIRALLEYIANLMKYLGPRRSKNALECLKVALEFAKQTEELPCLD